MPPLFGNLVFILRELLRIPLDLVSGVRHRVYLLSNLVDAPKDVAWAVASAHKIKLSPGIELDTEPDPARPGVFAGVCRYGEKALPYAYRVSDEKPGEAFTFHLLPDECDPVYHFGDNFVGAVAIAGDAHRSVITSSYELTHTRLSSRLLMPLTVLRGTQLLKRAAEIRAGTSAATSSGPIKNAVLTGALTFASFFALFGWSTAAILLAVILIHELGHVVAMRSVGIPVRGIYFIPFFGGVAVGEGLGANEATRGYVALMGPAFSILTTVLFALLSLENQDPFYAGFALASAVINGINLLPIMPLDGGRVLQALLSRAPEGAARAVHAATLLAGVGLAATFRDYLLLAVILLIAPGVLRAKPSLAMRPRPLTLGEGAWLAAGYAATVTFYVVVTLTLWNQTLLPAA